MGLAEDADPTGMMRPDIVPTPLSEPSEIAEVLDYDSELLPIVQMRTLGFAGPLWSEQKARLRHFHFELSCYISYEK